MLHLLDMNSMKSCAALLSIVLWLTAAAVRAQDSNGLERLAASIGELGAGGRDLGPEALASRADELVVGLSARACAGAVAVAAAEAVAAEKGPEKRKVYHVTYVKGVGWKIKAVGAKRASYIVRSRDTDLILAPEGVRFAKPGPGSALTTLACAARGISAGKECAIARAKELARKAGLGQVVVHGEDGKIQTEYTYGRDPNPPKG